MVTDRALGLMGNSVAWMYGSRGKALSESAFSLVEHPSFHEGSTITLSLDLTARGTPSASLDHGETSFQLFDNMLEAFGGTVGFVPAVSIGRPSKVQFLGFTESNADRKRKRND